MTHKLTCPAPRRASRPTENGFIDTPYTERDVLVTKSGGGYFFKGLHEFASKRARALAFGTTPKDLDDEDE